MCNLKHVSGAGGPGGICLRRTSPGTSESPALSSLEAPKEMRHIHSVSLKWWGSERAMGFEIEVFCKSLPGREFLTLKDIVLNEKSQSQKSTCYMLTWKLRTGASIGTELVSCEVGMGGVKASDS